MSLDSEVVAKTPGPAAVLPSQLCRITHLAVGEGDPLVRRSSPS